HFTKNGKTNFIEYWINPTELKSYHVRNIDLMQSTGMKDKNGVEIFEGDVVITSKGAIGYVAYLQQEAGFVVVLKKSDYRLGHRNTGESYDVATAHEVIGNIYENSELLEVE
ncbi:YopX family protein, partial [Enterococcus faecium]|nr:YopX family protein [Enterococcus faecium]